MTEERGVPQQEADPSVAPIDGGDSVSTFTVSRTSGESVAIQADLRASMDLGDASSFQDFESLPVNLNASAASQVSREDGSVNGSGSSDGKRPAKKMQRNE